MENTISYSKTAGSIVIVLLLLFFGHTSYAQNTDINWLRSINNSRSTQVDGVMEGVTNSVYPITVAVPLGQLIYGYARHDSLTISNGWQTAASLAVTTVVAFGLKFAVNRKRPYQTYSDIHPYKWDTDPSFPSGHTSYAFATATTLSLEYHKWYVVAPAYLYAATVGYSRMYLGMHYPSDVLAGALVGAGSAWLSYKCNRWLQHTRKKIIHH